MFNQNRGYVGCSRSVRSENAIENFEVPKTMIKKSLIECYLDEFEDEYTVEQLNNLKQIKVCLWKHATLYLKANSWHHTSSYFNQTDHYSLESIADMLLEKHDEIAENYKNELIFAKENKEKNVEYGYIIVNIWGGTRNRPKIIGQDEKFGVVVDNYLYFLEEGKIKKYQRNANKVLEETSKKSYEELKKIYKKNIPGKRYFNEILKKLK